MSEEGGNIEKIRGYYIKDFINYLVVERNLAKRTVQEYERDIGIFFEFFRDYLDKGMSLADFDERTVREFMTHLRIEKGYTPRAMNRKLAAVRSYFRFIESEGFVEKSPVSSMKSNKLDKRLPKVLTQEDVMRIIDAAERTCAEKSPEEYDEKNYKSFVYIRDCAIIELFYASGMRISELVGLDISDIDFKNKTVRVTGKGNKQRIVIINDHAVDALNNYLAMRPDEQTMALFLNRNRTRISARAVEIMFAKNKNRSGVIKPASPHTMRHSFATHLLQGGSDVVTIKELLGHENLATTQIYTNISMDHIKETYENAHPRAGIRKDSLKREDKEKSDEQRG